MYEAKGVFLNTDTGYTKLYNPLIQEYFNNETVLLKTIPTKPWPSVRYHKLARVTRNTQSSNVASLDDIIGGKSGRIELNMNLRQYAKAVTIEDAAIYEFMATGVGALGNVFAEELEKTAIDLAKDLNVDYYGTNITGAVTTGEKVDGLRGLLATSGNIYGHARAGYSGLKTTINSSTTAVSVEGLRTAITACKTAGASKNNLVIVTNPTIRTNLLNKFEANKMYVSTSSRVGFEGELAIDGVPLIEDADCPSGYIFVINLPDVYRVQMIAPSLGTKELGKTNLTTTRYIWTIQNIFVERFDTHYVFSAISS